MKIFPFWSKYTPANLHTAPLNLLGVYLMDKKKLAKLQES